MHYYAKMALRSGNVGGWRAKFECSSKCVEVDNSYCVDYDVVANKFAMDVAVAIDYGPTTNQLSASVKTNDLIKEK